MCWSASVALPLSTGGGFPAVPVAATFEVRYSKNIYAESLYYYYMTTVSFLVRIPVAWQLAPTEQIVIPPRGSSWRAPEDAWM